MKNISATYKGLITGLAMVLAALFFYYILKIQPNGKQQYILYIIYTLGIIWSLFSFKKTITSEIKFKNYFNIGFKTFIVVTLIMVLYTFIFYKFNHQIMEAGIIENNALLLKEGNHTPTEIEINANKLRDIFMPMMIGLTTFTYLIIGALISVIGAGFLSQKK